MIDLPTESDPVRIIHADCMDVLPHLPAGCVDAVVTDPPYLTGDSRITYEHAGVCDRISPTTTVGMPWGYSLDWIDVAAALDPQHWVVFAHYKMLGDMLTRLEKYAETMSVFAWRKSNAPNMSRPVPRADCEFIVWSKAKRAKCGDMGKFRSLVIDVPMPQAGCMASERIVIPGSGKAAHPCQKPIAVVRPFLRRLPIQSVIDPFAGSGTTLVASLAEGRNAIGIERDPTYVAIARNRVEAAMCRGPGSLLADVL